MTSPAMKQLKNLQKALYDKAVAEAYSVVAASSKSILNYSESFAASLPSTFSSTTLAELLDAMRKRQFILYGDFHTLRQSQRGLLRLLRIYAERLRTRKIVVALEMFKAAHQPYLNAYLAGQMREKEFLEKVDYHDVWGFPWQNFKMILELTQELKLPVIGINTNNAGRDSLAVRDQFAAKIMIDAAESYPDHKIVCLIGEYHLADNHLPAALNQEFRRRGGSAKCLRILNNVDNYYFQMQREGLGISPEEYLLLKRDFFCIMNSPPWIKWQSFSMWEESRHADFSSVLGLSHDDHDDESEVHTEESFDVDYQFFSFVKDLANFLDLKLDTSDLESFHIYFSREGEFFRDITFYEYMDDEEAWRIIERTTADGVYFISHSNTILVTYVSINNLAEAAGQYLHRLLTNFVDQGATQAESFCRKVLKYAIGMIASKILNPRRKCLELNHFNQIVRQHEKEKSNFVAKTRHLAAKAIIKHNDFISAKIASNSRKFSPPPRGIVHLDRQQSYAISRSIGHMLGLNFYKKVIANKVPASELRKLFRKKLTNIDDIWKEILNLYQIMDQ